HARAGHLEVVELLRIEVGHDASLPLLGQISGGDGGGFPAVVPASKPAEQRRTVEARALHEADRIHRLSISAGFLAKTPDPRPLCSIVTAQGPMQIAAGANRPGLPGRSNPA